MPDIALTVEGERYRGWTSATVRRSISELAGAWSVEYADSATASGRGEWWISTGEEASLTVDGRTLISGRVVSFNHTQTADDVVIASEGYSYAGVLTRASAAHKPGYWRNARVADIVSGLLEPYGIDALLPAGLGEVKRFAIEDGESVADCLWRLAEAYALTLSSLADGTIQFWRAGDAPRGQLPNLPPIRRTLRADNRDRHSHYLTRAQLVSGAETEITPGMAVTDEGQVVDPDMREYCPLIVPVRGPGGRKRLEDRALLERNIRAGRGRAVELTYTEALDREGNTLEPGTIVPYTDPWLDLWAELMIDDVEIGISDSGIETTLTLVPPSTYSTLDIKPWWVRR